MLQAADLRPIADCIAKRRANISQTISGRKTFKECQGAERWRGSPPRLMWWDQELDFKEDGGAGQELWLFVEDGREQGKMREATRD